MVSSFAVAVDSTVARFDVVLAGGLVRGRSRGGAFCAVLGGTVTVVGVHLPSEQSGVVLAGAVRLGGRVVTWPVEREAMVSGPRDGAGVRGPALTPSVRGARVASVVALSSAVVRVASVRSLRGSAVVTTGRMVPGRMLPPGERVGGSGFVAPFIVVICDVLAVGVERVR